MNNFNGLEIIRTAILMEEEGSKFYTNFAKHATGKVKDFLLIAAGQEFVHKNKFQKIYDDLLGHNEAEYSYLFDEETTSYLRELVENNVYDENQLPEDGFKDIKVALEFAVKSEKNTVAFYTRMYAGITNSEVKEVISELIEEEKNHVDYFQILAKELS